MSRDFDEDEDELPMVPDLETDPDGDPGPEGEVGPQIVVVDGPTVIEGAEPLRALWTSDPSDAALRLVNLLSWAVGDETVEFSVYFEPAVQARAAEIGVRRVNSLRSEEGQTVAEAVMDELRRLDEAGRAAQTTVVTSDLETARFANERGIRTNLADLFAASLLGGSSATEEDEFIKPPGLSPKEEAEWDAFVAEWKKGRK